GHTSASRPRFDYEARATCVLETDMVTTKGAESGMTTKIHGDNPTLHDVLLTLLRVPGNECLYTLDMQGSKGQQYRAKIELRLIEAMHDGETTHYNVAARS